MGSTPKTFLIGFTDVNRKGLADYLRHTDQMEFYNQFCRATERGIAPGEALCSFYAKLCYKSLVLGKNDNVKAVRDIQDNITGCFDVGHGSVFEHVWLNFVTTDCSRVFTHELVRHRVGTAFSQTSGRYVSVQDAELVLPPEMEEVKMESRPSFTVVGGRDKISLGDLYREKLEELKQLVAAGRKALDLDNKPMAERKWWTSQLRRIMPAGQTNEIGWSANVRALRHLIEMRTSRHAEWEIRLVFNQVAELVQKRWPLMLYGAKTETHDGMLEYTELKV